jgi:hypothetical protein
MLPQREAGNKILSTSGRSSPYNQYMKLPPLVNGHAPRRKPAISAHASLADETFRGHAEHSIGTVARGDEALTRSSRSVEGWF